MSSINLDLSTAPFDAELARVDLTGSRLTLPLPVLLGEAADVAGYLDHHWEPKLDPATGRVLVPGLKSAGDKLPADTGQQIHALAELVQQAHFQVLATPVLPSGSPLPRARFVLGELSAALDWHFDDGVEELGDTVLARLHEQHDGANSSDELALALEDYAALARPIAAQLDGLGGFQAALLDEVPGLATALRQVQATPPQATGSDGEGQLTLRNKLIQLLLDRIRLVRRAAEFVYRNQPDIARQAQSAYARRQRAAAAKRAEQRRQEQQKLEQQKLEQQKLEQQKLEQQKLEQEQPAKPV